MRDLRLVPLKFKCSKKWAEPEVVRVSLREPAPIKTPTAAVGEFQLSVQTRMPLEMVVICIGLSNFKGSGISPKGRSPKFCMTGALEN